MTRTASRKRRREQYKHRRRQALAPPGGDTAVVCVYEFAITEEPIPDPKTERMAPRDRERLEVVLTIK